MAKSSGPKVSGLPTSGAGILLSAVLEGAAGEPFPVVLNREVFEPLGMERTVLDRTNRDPDTVSFYLPRAATDPKLGQEAPAAEYGCFYGAGAFLSTPSDLVRLGSAMLEPGLLKAETIALLQTPLQLKSGSATGFALGWKVDSIPLAGAQVRLVRHRGNFLGGTSSLSVFPDHGVVIAATSSGPYTTSTDAFALKVAESFVRSR
jgi:CubicO group peptidase (beta-lactamase class C family)